METIVVSGIVEEIIYTNPENGYTICDIESKEEGLFTAVGYMPYVSEGESLTLTGAWTNHPDYGEQLKVMYYEAVLPTDEESVLKYLSSGIVHGIREATAKKLVDRFGADILQILLNEPERISEIKGISKKRALEIGKNYQELQSVQGIVMFLQQYNISANMAVKVHSILGSDAVNQIKENPYVLSDRIDGITFKSSDAIAFNMGLPKNSVVRIRSGIKYILQDAAYSNGHTYLPKSVLLEHTVYNLKVEEAEAENALSELTASREVFLDTVDNTKVCYLYSFYEAEYYISRKIASMAIQEQKFKMTRAEADESISRFEEEAGITLAPEQQNAVATAMSEGCMILTGGPGTGKTTTIKTIIKLLEEKRLSVALAAPTGRAAKRMSEVTGLEAKTIHRLLGTQVSSAGYHVFTHNEENPLKADVIILDEVSMIDVNLMSSFLKALKFGARLILSGDSDQLPSVGPGNVLRDIIDSGVVPVIHLSKIFRQAQQSLIVVNAHKINRGELPDLSQKASDFFFLRRRTPEQSASTVVDLFQNRLPKSYGIEPLYDIQVLSPTKKGISGTVNLNKLLQSSINPPRPERAEHKYGNTVFRVGDKVMQTKNNYDIMYSRDDGSDGMGIFNGDMGIIREINLKDKFLTIVFDEDKEAEYPFTMLDEIDLAYAVTVHKSQGSEFPYVIMPVCSYNPLLMSRNLFYTAVTRAKKMVILVGSEKTVQNMTYNNSYQQRFTGLNEKLCGLRRLIGNEENKA